jgi:hypothetical protein
MDDVVSGINHGAYHTLDAIQKDHIEQAVQHAAELEAVDNGVEK